MAPVWRLPFKKTMINNKIWSLVCAGLMVIALLSLSAEASAAEKHKYTLVIDAGHGGKDGGACANGAKEKNINLSVALAFGRYVEKNCPDVRVIYTRKTDVFIPLHQRADIANKNKADVFISIHTNSVQSKRPISGMETYTMGLRRSGEKLSAAMRENEVVLIEKDFQQHYAGFDPRLPESYIIFEVMNEANMVESVELAQLIQKKVCSTASRPNKGVKQDAFLVLRETSMPACLIELGYITTPAEAAYLTNPKNVDAMGKGIYQAFVEFRKAHDKTAPNVKQETAQPKKEEPKQETAQPKKESAQPKKEEPKQESAQPKKEEPKQEAAQPKETEPATAAVDSTDAPIFKVQFLGLSTKVSSNDKRFKGLTDVDCYQDGKLWKYTVGASANYQEIVTLRRQVAQQFPEAFIVAFRNGQRIDINEARNEYYKNKRKK